MKELVGSPLYEMLIDRENKHYTSPPSHVLNARSFFHSLFLVPL